MKKFLIPLCLIVLFSLGLFLYLNRFENYSYVEVDGYALNTNDIYSNLVNNKDDANITFEDVTVNDIIYYSNKKYFVGEEKKKKINLDYPIISKDKSSLFIASSLGDLIDENFSSESTYSGMILTGSKAYNTVNHEQATDYNYYFLVLNNGIYVNLSEMIIKTDVENIIIPSNSFINILESSINYYYVVDDMFVYASYPVVNLTDSVTIDNFGGTYKELLLNLNIINERHVNEDLVNGIDDPNNTGSGDQDEGTSTDIADSNPDYIHKDEEKDEEEEKWVDPIVEITGTYSKTYTYRGVLNIVDPSNAIYKMPTFEFSIGEAVVLRKTPSGNGSFKISGLKPDTEYTVTAYYEFTDELGRKKRRSIDFNGKKAYKDTFKTKGIDSLEQLKLNYGEISTTDKAFSVDDLYFDNKIGDEVLEGIKTIIISANDTEFKLSASDTRNFVNLKPFLYESSSTLKSNTDYNAIVKVYDTDDNLLKISNNTFSFLTKQKAPSVKSKVIVSKNFTKATLKLDLTNDDKVIISNYRYVLYDENMEEYYSAKAYENKNEYTLTGLDSAKKYYVKVFCDYKTIQDYTYKDVEIGSIEFVSFDIEKLGNIAFNVSLNDDREDYITSSSASLRVAYAIFNREDPLYVLLDDEIGIQIVDSNTGEVYRTYYANKDDLLQEGTIVNMGYTDDDIEDGVLPSNTKFEVNFIPSVTSGTKKIYIKSTVNSKGFNFTTLKVDAYVTLSNVYVADGYIDFDVNVIDKDCAILDSSELVSDKILLEVTNSHNEKISSQEISISHTNDPNDIITDRITIDNLNAKEKYNFNFKATNYYNNLTSESGKLLNGSRSYTLSGLSGSLEIEQMIKAVNYYSLPETNLFELSNLNRWKSTLNSGYNTTEMLSANIEENTLSLSAYNGYRVYSYYLPELINKNVVFSFEAKRGTDRTEKVYLVNGVTTSVRSLNDYNVALTGNYNSYDLALTDEFTEFKNLRFKLNSSGYFSIYIRETDNLFYKNTAIFKNFQVEYCEKELSECESTDYRSYDASQGYIGTFYSNLSETIAAKDANVDYQVNEGNYEYYKLLINRDTNEIIDKYYFEFKNDGVPIEKQFDNIQDDNKYSITLAVYDAILERYYYIDTLDFESDAEIRVIKNINDFYNMHTNGHYIVINDLDFSNTGSVYSGQFNGTLDFQGHKLIMATKNRTYLFSTLGGGAIVENFDLHILFNNTRGLGSYRGLVHDNYGNVRNFMMTIDEGATDQPNIYVTLMGYRNFGTFENFVINSKSSIHTLRYMSFGPENHYGTIKNGYIYGCDVEATRNIPIQEIENNTPNKYIGLLAMAANSGAIIENVYTSISILLPENPSRFDTALVGTLVANISNATVRNAYVYDGATTTTRLTNKDIMFGNASSINYSNLYRISEVEYTETYSIAQQETALQNVAFQNNTINRENMFLTTEAWRLNIYPHLKFDSFMPTQDNIPLPSIGTTETIKFLAVDQIKYYDDEVTVAEATLSFYNPNNLTIRAITIKDIGEVRLVGKPSTNSDKITTVIVKILNPKSYLSYYTLSAVSTPSATITINATMAMVLYKNVSSLSEITNMRMNYKLMNDIDCSKSKCTKINSTYRGRLNGAGYTISNLNVDSCFIQTLNGTLENINFDNFKANIKSSYSGLVCSLTGNGKIDTVYSHNMTIGATSNLSTVYVGGLAGYVNSGSIQNSSVNKIIIDSPLMENTIPNVGGIAGYVNNGIINTVFARNIDFNFVSSPADNTGIGGIIGYFNSGKLVYSYSTGTINANVNYVGGIAGKLTGSSAYVIGAIGATDINGDQDYIGGIVGYSVSTNSITRTLVLGNLATKKGDALYFDRSSGTSFKKSRNFAWDRQFMNNLLTISTNGEILLSQEELWNPNVYNGKINLGGSFDLEDNFRTGYIPYMISSPGVYLRGQGYYEDEGETEESLEDLRILYEEIFSINYYEATPHYKEGYEGDQRFIDSYELYLEIKNNKSYRIKGLTIDGLNIEVLRDFTTKDNISYVTFKVTPKKYFDNYSISNIVYQDGQNEKTAKTNLIIDLQFFGEINSLEDWKKIEVGYYENYVLTNNIDLEGNCDANITGKSFNKLVGYKTDNYYTIANATCVYTKRGSSFIDTIVSNLEYVRFDNIKLSTGGKSLGGNYMGFIKYQNGILHNVEFNNIDALFPGTNYVGVISVNQSPDTRNIKYSNINLQGTHYTGVIGKTISVPIVYVDLYNVKINSNGNYVGGLLGYGLWKERMVYNTYINAEKMDVYSSGSYVGGVFGYGAGNHITIKDSSIKGNQRVGGISGEHNSRNIYYNYAHKVKVQGNYYVGGIAGINQNLYYIYVTNSEISGLGSNYNTNTYKGYYIGGLVGYGGWSVYYSGISNSVVQGYQGIGGVKGLTSWGAIGYSYVKDTNVYGYNYIGGISGYAQGGSNTIHRCVTNANVKAQNTAAGGIIGYHDNRNTTSYNYKLYIYHNIRAGGTVSAKNYAGGLIGRIQKELFKGHYYNNLIESHVSCTSTCDYVIGNGDAYTSNINKLFVYAGSTLKVNNGPTLTLSSDSSASGFVKSAAVSLDELKKTTFYGSSKLALSGFTYNSNTIMTSYPRPNSIQNITVNSVLNNGDTNTYVDYSIFLLPDQRSNVKILQNVMYNSDDLFHEIPDAYVYTSSVDTINIDFENIDEYSYLVLNNEKYKIDSLTKTIKFDFSKDFEFYITDGQKIKNYSIKLSDLLKNINVVDNNYYVIKDNKVITNDENVSLDNAVNIFDKEILLKDNSIYNIENHESRKSDINNYSITNLVSLYDSEIFDNKIKTYATYSTIDDDYIEDQVFVKNNDLEIISAELENKKDVILIDNYNGNNHLIYLGNDKHLHSLKDPINYPSKFINADIRDISTNLYSNTDLLGVLYENGNFMIFNYKTGSLVYDSNEYKPNIIEYTLTYYDANFTTEDVTVSTNSEYRESEKLVTKLQKNPIKHSINQDGTINKDEVIYDGAEVVKYTIKYNPVKKKYSVYSINKDETDNLVSQLANNNVSDIIKSNKELSNYYGLDAELFNDADKGINKTIILTIFGFISLLLILLGNIVLRKIRR